MKSAGFVDLGAWHGDFDAPAVNAQPMDIPRRAVKRRPIVAIVTTLALIAATLAAMRLKPAAPSLDRSGLWLDHVSSGPFVQEARGSGSLAPQEVRWLVAESGGRVDRVRVDVGAEVEAGEVLIELSNPDLELRALEAERQLLAAEAERVSLKTKLATERMSDESNLAGVRTGALDAIRRAAADSSLFARGLIAGLQAEHSSELADEWRTRLRNEEARNVQLDASRAEALALHEQQVAQLRAIARAERERVAALAIRADAAGVVQELSLELGQYCSPGQTLAKIAGGDRLKAILRVPEAQASGIVPGQDAIIDASGLSLAGRVRRVDPKVEQSSVRVEVELVGELPAGLRPDQTVTGRVELARLDAVLSVARPTGAQAGERGIVFRVDPRGRVARRTPVRFGAASESRIVIEEGLREGDQVILSDVSPHQDEAELRLH